MRFILTLSTSIIFLALGGLHLFWAAGGKLGGEAAVPSIDGTPAFVPGRFATLLVAGALISAAFVVAAAGRAIILPLPAQMVTVMASLLAIICAARAIGDFRLVGFFKLPSDSKFAHLDTLIYSPLCACLALAILLILVTR